MDHYKEVSCKCGFTYEKNKEEFEIYNMKLASIRGQDIRKPVPRCKTCKTISILQRETEILEDEDFKDMPSLKKIVQAEQTDLSH